MSGTTNSTRGGLIGLARIRALLLWLLLAALFAGCSAPSQTARPDLDPLAGDMQQLIDFELVAPLEVAGGTVGVVVLDLEGNLLAEHDGSRLMTPASVQKLATTADALLHLPADYRWPTELMTNGELRGDTLFGDLLIAGHWDPTLAGPEPYSDWPWRRLNEAAKHLYSLGIHHIDGDIIGVGKLYVPGVWEAGDLFYRYAPAISALSWNDGLLTTWSGMLEQQEMRGLWPDSSQWTQDHAGPRVPTFEDPPGWVWRPDSLQALFQRKADPVTSDMDETDHAPVADPRWLTVDAFRIALHNAGVTGGEGTQVMAELPVGTSWRQLALLEGNSRDSVLAGLLSVSSNLWAEMVEATVNEQEGRGRPGTPGWTAALDSLGVDQRGLRATDACGLARSNALSARTLADLLVAANSRWGDEWIGLLPYPEKPLSTLSKRLEGEAGRLALKTGSLSRVRSLAGYVLRDGRPVVAFAVIANNASIDAEPILDGFARRLAEAKLGRIEERRSDDAVR